jgi:hypothetical protein
LSRSRPCPFPLRARKRRNVTHGCTPLRVAARKAVVIRHGSEAPIEAVACDPKGDPPGLLVFSVFFSDHGEHEDDDADVCCAACIIEEHPELGRAFDLAKRGRSAWTYDPASGNWRSVQY